MDKGDASKDRVLEPVVVEALKAITRRVYHRRRPELWHRFRRYYSMLDSESRDSTIAAFEHLRNSGYDFPPFLVRRWAIANGWKKMDAQLLDDYAAGVLARVKYHHTDPMGRQAIETWRADALGREPWVDPGRSEHGTPFTRRN
jgi:hypothetical protein